MTRTLKPEPLTDAAFAPFGNVIHAGGARGLTINYGATTRFDDLAHIDVSAEGGRTNVSLFRSKPLNPPIVIEVMERHPLGSQAFIPMDRRPFLIVVAPEGDFDADRIVAFLASGGQGVNYARGVWHHYCLALEDASDFLVIDRAGPGDNLDEVRLPPEQQWVVEV